MIPTKTELGIVVVLRADAVGDLNAMVEGAASSGAGLAILAIGRSLAPRSARAVEDAIELATRRGVYLVVELIPSVDAAAAALRRSEFAAATVRPMLSRRDASRLGRALRRG